MHHSDFRHSYETSPSANRSELEREQLIRELAVKNAESETLRESFAAIVGTFEFSEIIQHILDQIGRVIPYDSASVWKVEGNMQKFISRP